jgi:membrane peptidoglycan carboxypeptidase
VQSPQNGCIGTKYPFLCDYIHKSLLKTPSLGKTKQDRENKLNRGGLTIKTKIDPKAQDKAQEAVSNFIDAKDPVISTMSMIQPSTGLILGMAQNRPKMGSHANKGETYYNYAVPQAMGGSPGGFQSGSTFKAITIAAALEKGIKPSKKYNATDPLNMSGKSFKTCKGHFRPPHYIVHNSTGHNGVMNMRKGTKWSVNTYFIQLEKTVGICRVAKMADKLGVRLANGKKIADSKYASAPSLTLGVANIAPMSLAEAYATFANRGVRCDPTIIDKITTHSGKKLKPRSAHCKRVISKHTADGVTSILKGVMSGTGKAAQLPGNRPTAGKTGTTDDYQALWFAGYTPQVAGVASIAEDLNQPPFNTNNGPEWGLKHYYLQHSHHPLHGSGGTDAGAGIWKPAMKSALKGKPKKKFAPYKKKSSNNSDHSEHIDLPDISGMSSKHAIGKLEDAGFTVSRSWIHSDKPAGRFIRFSQYSGKLPKHSTIYAFYSAGPEHKQSTSNNRHPSSPNSSHSNNSTSHPHRSTSHSNSSTTHSNRGTSHSSGSTNHHQKSSKPSKESGGKKASGNKKSGKKSSDKNKSDKNESTHKKSDHNNKTSGHQKSSDKKSPDHQKSPDKKKSTNHQDSGNKSNEDSGNKSSDKGSGKSNSDQEKSGDKKSPKKSPSSKASKANSSKDKNSKDNSSKDKSAKDNGSKDKNSGHGG